MLVFFLQEVSLGVLDSSDQSGILSAFECIMSHIYQPCLTALETWGELDSDQAHISSLVSSNLFFIFRVSKWAGTRYFYPSEIVYSTGRNY
jgi:hypothetical protein